MDVPCSSGVVCSGSESDGEPEAKRSRKWLGAATYRTKFNRVWTKEFPFITSVPKNPYRLVGREK